MGLDPSFDFYKFCDTEQVIFKVSVYLLTEG